MDTKTELQFPILDSSRQRLPKLPPSIPWALLAPHEKQALKNHSQTLQRLFERGGLSWSEIDLILQDDDFDGTAFVLPLQEAEFTAHESAAAVRVLARVRAYNAPDWPPAMSALNLPDGTEQCGSTGQLWQVIGGQWHRLRGQER